MPNYQMRTKHPETVSIDDVYREIVAGRERKRSSYCLRRGHYDKVVVYFICSISLHETEKRRINEIKPGVDPG